jgi:hypothetical protein
MAQGGSKLRNQGGNIKEKKGREGEQERKN